MTAATAATALAAAAVILCSAACCQALVHTGAPHSWARKYATRQPVADTVLAETAAPGFSAAVIVEADQAPFGGNESAAELLRFVTAYGGTLEALVDISAYHPVLASVAGERGDLEFYASVDTWVGNGPGDDVLYMGNVSHRCTALPRSYGNGWALTLDLVLWPLSETSVDTRPTHSVMLASGHFGGTFPIGVVSLTAGTVEAEDSGGGYVDFEVPADVSTATSPPAVFRCTGGSAEAAWQALLGYGASAAHQLRLQALTTEQHRDAQQDLRLTLLEILVSPHFVEALVQHVDEVSNTVVISFNTTAARLVPQMPVFYASGQVLTDQMLDRTHWWNLTYPFSAVGHVEAVNGSRAVLKMKYPCLPTTRSGHMPDLLVPTSPLAWPRAQELTAAVIEGDSSWFNETVKSLKEPLLLQPRGGWSAWQAAMRPAANGTVDKSAHLQKVMPIGEVIDDGTATLSSPRSGTGDRVCVVAQRRQGLVFARRFQLPSAAGGGGRTLVQLAVTGHGWAATTEGCGEYCHAVYQLRINGRSAANVTQWRGDCGRNPVDGSEQRGTWWEHRNGWCPGSVEPGLYLDVTGFAAPGDNSLELSVLVWSNATSKYEPYADFTGFALGDQASLVVGLSAFVYPADAVAAILAQPKGLTAAEVAIRTGCSSPAALRPAEFLSQPAPEEAASTQTYVDVGGIERSAPWYTYNESVMGPPGFSEGAVAHRVFDAALLQSSSRIVRGRLPAGLPPGQQRWGRAALRLRLEAPAGLEADRWDRLGSVGVVLPGGNQMVNLTVQGSIERRTRARFRRRQRAK